MSTHRDRGSSMPSGQIDLPIPSLSISSSSASSPSPAPVSPPVLARKPMATARQVSLFEREIRLKLSGSAIDILFDLAETLSEGQRQGSRYYGSTMITIDLAKATILVRDDCDAAGARRVADLLARDSRARQRARAIALAHAEARAGGRLSQLGVDLKTRSAGTRVEIDLDVDGHAAAGSQTA
ncbi:MAG: hypothetical protein V2A73_22935 [Pseudomonadota bacterium]